MKKFFKVTVCLLIIFLIIIFAVFPDRYLESSLKGIQLWALIVLPSLLPFFFLTALLTKMNVLSKLSSCFDKITAKLFRCDGIVAYAFFTSIISGYPVGSRTIYDLYKSNLIDSEQATRMSVLCSTSGPLFIIGSVGIGMFSNKKIGFILIISHILSAFLCGIIFRGYGSYIPKKNKMLSPLKSDNLLYESIYNSVISVLLVGGFISVFYVFSEICSDFYILYPLQKFFYLVFLPFTNNTEIAKGFVYGIIECTKGCMVLSVIQKSALTISLSAALISLGGLSIIAQSVIFLSQAKVKIKIFLFSKCVQSILSFIIAYLLILLLF